MKLDICVQRFVPIATLELMSCPGQGRIIFSVELTNCCHVLNPGIKGKLPALDGKAFVMM